MTELRRLRCVPHEQSRRCAPWPNCPSTPVSLAESTLVLIDCQNTYTQGVMELEGVQAALDEAAALLDRARSAGIPIIHVQHSDGPGLAVRHRGRERRDRRRGSPRATANPSW